MTDPNRLNEFLQQPLTDAHTPGQGKRPFLRAVAHWAKRDPGLAGIQTFIVLYAGSCAAGIALLGADLGSAVGSTLGIGAGFLAGQAVMKLGQRQNRNDLAVRPPPKP